jgi:hypothetical protein
MFFIPARAFWGKFATYHLIASVIRTPKSGAKWFKGMSQTHNFNTQIDLIRDMDTGKAEMYSKCEKKLEMILSKRDCDLRILVGHSTMLQSLMPYVFPERESPQVSIQECRAESDIIAHSEHEEFSPLLYEISVTERELLQQGAKIQQAEQISLKALMLF